MRLEVPVDLIANNDAGVPTWTLRAVGPGIETQRRSYIRMEIERDVQLYILEGGAPTDARLLDISEGGFRCKVDNWLLDPGRENFFESDKP